MKAQSTIWWLFVLVMCGGGPLGAALIMIAVIVGLWCFTEFQLWFHEHRKEKRRKKWRAKLRARGILPPDDNS